MTWELHKAITYRTQKPILATLKLLEFKELTDWLAFELVSDQFDLLHDGVLKNIRTNEMSGCGELMMVIIMALDGAH